MMRLRPWILLLKVMAGLCVAVALYAGSLIGIGWFVRFSWEMLKLGWLR
jgi:hypothetical protein